MAYVAWLDAQQNEPDRGDHYVMQSTMLLAFIYRVLSGAEVSDKLDGYRIRYETAEEQAEKQREAVEREAARIKMPGEPRRLTKEDIAFIQQQQWLVRMAAKSPEAKKLLEELKSARQRTRDREAGGEAGG